MKMWDWIKIFGSSNIKSKSEIEYKLTINRVIMEKAVVHSTKSHSKTYSLLRAFKTPQYDNLYVLRNKKGFNTLGFNLKYDVVVADKDGKVLDTIGAIKVGTVSRHYKTAHLIMFMPVGSLNFYDVKKLDQIRLTRKW